MTDRNYTGENKSLQPSRRNVRRTPLLKSEFLEMAFAKHGDKFDYSLVPSTGIKKKGKVTIICKTCGYQFEQIVRNHVDIGNGCASCAGKKTLTADEFIAKAMAVHGDKYDYSDIEYKMTAVKVTLLCKACNKYFKVVPKAHIHQGIGCRTCSFKALADSRRLTNEQFLERALAIHGNKYTYDKSVYKGCLEKLIVTCPEHGDFKIRPNCLFNGKGCAKCAREGSVGFTRERFERVCLKNNGLANLYLIKMSRDDDVFYKIGITSKAVSKRMGRLKATHDIAVIFQMQGDAGFIYDLEKRVHELLSCYHYTPEITFGGSAKECFSCVPKSIMSLLHRLKQSKQLCLLA